jgi:Spx/MgsR family transcriptional regulator
MVDMLKLFGIPNCDTVKKARVFLEKEKLSYEFVDFKKDPPTLHELENWTRAFGGLPVNTKGITFKKLKAEFESLSYEDKLSFIQENTSMIKRPVLEREGVVLALGFDEAVYRLKIK